PPRAAFFCESRRRLMRRPLLALLEKLLDHVDYRFGDVGSRVALCLQVLEDAVHIPDDGSIIIRLRGRPFAEVNHSGPHSTGATRRLPKCWTLGRSIPVQNILNLRRSPGASPNTAFFN